MKTAALASPERIYSIDTFRLVSIFFVILHHIAAFKNSFHLYYPNPLLTFLYYFPENVRFLPFFFIAAGYFFRKGVLRGEPLSDRLFQYCTRLGMLFLFWSFFYMFFIVPGSAALHQHYHIYQVFQVFHLNVIEIINHPFEFLWEGTVGAFWFFPSLILGLNIIAALYAWGKEKYILPLGFVLYVIALLGKSYSVLPWGYHVEFEMRRGPFVSVLFVGIGWFLARKENFRLKTALLLIVGGLGLQILETLFFYLRYGVKPGHDYLFGTILFCTGIFVLALARPNVGKNTIFPQLGQLTLGVYVLHTFYIKLFGICRPYFPTLTYEILQPMVVFLLSIFTALLLKRSSLTRVLVT